MLDDSITERKNEDFHEKTKEDMMNQTNQNTMEIKYKWMLINSHTENNQLLMTSKM